MKRILLITMVALAVGVVVPAAHADMVLSVDDPTTLGIDVIVVDGKPVGTATAIGLSTVADPSADGFMSISQIIGSWSATVTTGFSKPLIGGVTDPQMHLDEVVASSSAGGTLTVRLTDQDFFPGPGWTSTSLISEIGGVLSGGAGSYLTLDQILDASNTQFASLPGTLAVSLAGSLGSFSSSGIATGSLVAGPFSLTENLVIHHAGTGDSSVNAVSTVVPVPGAILLGFLGLGAAGLKLRRFA